MTVLFLKKVTLITATNNHIHACIIKASHPYQASQFARVIDKCMNKMDVILHTTFRCIFLKKICVFGFKFHGGCIITRHWFAYWLDARYRPLRWRHNERDGVLNHQPHDCLLNRRFRRRSKKTSKLRVTGLWAGNSPVTGEFPAQRASNAENVSIWWRHHAAPETMPMQITDWSLRHQSVKSDLKALPKGWQTNSTKPSTAHQCCGLFLSLKSNKNMFSIVNLE